MCLLLVVAMGGLAGCGAAKQPSVASVETTTSTRSAGRTTTDASGSPPGRKSAQSPALQFAHCMRANGVPGFPDPNAGGGFSFGPGSGVDPASSAFKTAQAKCQKELGGGLAAGAKTHPTAQWLAQMVRAAECMRHHGFPKFPDPVTTVPDPSVLGGKGVISNIDGAVFVFPADAVDTASPAFARASKACGFPLHNH